MKNYETGKMENLDIRPKQKKKLGQVFLQHEDMMSRIITSVGINPRDTVIEIGAGDGRISDLMRHQVNKLILVEIDPEFQDVLFSRFGSMTNVKLICGDILAVATLEQIREELQGDKAVIYGSIPYYITTPIMKWVIENRDLFKGASLLMQKEVARRVVAGCGSKEYGFLSVIMQLSSDVSLGPLVGRKQFKPIPKVDSQVLHISLADQEKSLNKAFTTFVSTVFQQRRKQINNTIANFLGRKLTEPEKTFLAEKGFRVDKRPENFSPQELLTLYQLLKEL